MNGCFKNAIDKAEKPEWETTKRQYGWCCNCIATFGNFKSSKIGENSCQD